jgi:hypothetical protein
VLCETPRLELQAAPGLKHEDHFRLTYLLPAFKAGLVAMTIPDTPHSRLQIYRLTNKGRAWIGARPQG